jgi:hypothetical protein
VDELTLRERARRRDGTCPPKHGVGDNMAMEQNKLAVDTRTFPVLIYDPRKDAKIADRLSLQGNPATKEDWYKVPKSGELFDFTMFARSEGRFAKHFDKDGKPSETILRANQDGLENWCTLQELAGIIRLQRQAWGHPELFAAVPRDLQRRRLFRRLVQRVEHDGGCEDWG